MDIRQQQAYYQQMRQQQVYRAYAAGIGSDPTPPPTPTLYNIKFVTDYYDPEVFGDISVSTETQDYTDIKINGDGKNILSGNTISYWIQLSNDQPVPRIATINGESIGEPMRSYESQFVLNEDTTISVGLISL